MKPSQLRARYWRIVFFFGRVTLGFIIWEILVPRLGMGAVARRNRPERNRRTAARFRAFAAGMGVLFVGGHPIAGTENAGFPAAVPSLFRGRSFIATPTRRTNEGALLRVERLWRLAGTKVAIRMDPKTHDRVFAYVSHLPHVVAYALVHSVATLPSRVPLGYSAGGFRDFTRIASSNPEMWKDIVLQNREEVLRAVAHYRRNLDLLVRRIAGSDAEGLRKYFARAKKTRDGLETS